MSKDPAFLFYPGDYLRDIQMLSPKAHVAYDRLMCEHMRNICISQQQLNFITKALLPDEKEELMAVLQQVDDGFQIEWVATSIYKRRLYSESRAKNRSKKNKKNISKHMKNICEHMENENENENTNENKIEIGNWNFTKTSFFNSDQWMYQFCTSKVVSRETLVLRMQEFINDIELRNEYKELKELQRHFTNWYNKSEKLKKNAKPSKNQSRDDLVESLRQKHAGNYLG